MKLECLPEELLAQISAYLHWLDVGNLWLCGNGALNRRLANGGAAQLEVEICSDVTRFFWPSFVESLSRLKQFHMSDYGEAETAPQMGEKLMSLPATLRELKLLVPGALLALNLYLIDNPDAFPAISSLTIESNELEDYSTITELRWPRSLNFLHFYSAGKPFALNPTSLPPHLTYLDACFHSICEGQISSFPASLEALIISLGEFHDLLPLLPPTLKHFELAAIPGAHIPEKWQSDVDKWFGGSSPLSFPPSLTVLLLPIDTYSAALLAQLPHSITEIIHHGTSIDPQDVPLLPPQLRVSGTLLPSTITPTIAKLLPKSITESMSRVEVEALPLVEHWCSFRLSVSSSGELVKKLKAMNLPRIPGSLSRLSMFLIKELPIQVLPEKLERLSVISLASDASFSISHLPRTLQSLNIADYLSSRLEDWKLLPNLTSLYLVKCHALTIESSCYLPRTLQSLQIERMDSVDYPLEWFDGLPKTLTRLGVPIRLPDSPLKINLPPFICRLELSVMGHCNGDAPNRFLKVSFPKSLTSLTLNFREVTDPTFQHLKIGDISNFFRANRRIAGCTLLACCETICMDDLRQSLPPTCHTATFS